MVRLIARLLQHGARHVSGGTWECDLAMRCEAPVVVERTARPSGRYVSARTNATVKAILEQFPGAIVDRVLENTDNTGWRKQVEIRPGKSAITHTIRLFTRCRKCAWCLEQRRKLWAARAIAETRKSARTWLGTLTFSPESHHAALSRARMLLHHNGDDYERLDPRQQYAARHRALSPVVTLWLKRVRKECQAPLRYCLVWEAHASGLPHAHVLLHEVDAERPVRKRLLQAQWQANGFSNFKLVEDVYASAYVAKYLSKDAMARVRASVSYGEGEAGNIRPNVIA